MDSSLIQPTSMEKEAQADIPEPDFEEEQLKIRPLERVTRHPKVPPEPSAYGKYKNYSRHWILQDGREPGKKGSEMRDSYTSHAKAKRGYREGIRKRLLTDFFWEQMLEEMMEDLTTAQPVTDYCSEYDSNYIKDQFEPRNLAVTADKNTHLTYPLYGTGSSAVTYYSETIKKIGPGEILEKFRRCQDFSKPMEERLDNGWVL